MNDNNEIVIAIAEKIEQHRKGELKMNARSNAVGIANVNYFNAERCFWLMNNPNNRGISIGKDSFGNPIVVSRGRTTYEKDGQPIFKNTKIGELIIRHSKGTFDVKTPTGLHKLTIFNNAFYTPERQPYLAKDITINVNEPKPRYYNSLNEIIKQIDELDKAIIEAERLRKEEEERIEREKIKDTKRRDEIIEKIDQAKEKKEEALKKMQSFIRRSAELRYQPVLDPWQEEVKRSFLFNGTVAIDGGPGTGKTTSLIQRMKFLTDAIAIEDYLPNLTQKQKDLLYDSNNWIFYSPSELLKQFLKNNMTKEGLLANDETVKVWEEHKRTLLKKYKLINSETQNPFLVLRRFADEPLLPYDGKKLQQVIKAFEKFYLNYQNEKLNKLTAIDVSIFKWKNEGTSIKNYITRQEKAFNLDGLIRLYFNIEDNFAEEVKTISRQFNDLLTKSAASLIVHLEKTANATENIEALFDKWMEESLQTEEEILDIDEEVEQENEQNEEENEFDDKLLRKLKSLLRKSALISFDKNQRLAKRDKELNEIVSKFFNIKELPDFNEIGQLAFFTKYFERVTKGIRSNLISEIPALYKAFRKNALKNDNLPLNRKVLQSIVEKEKERNKRIHPEEQSLLIYFINKLIKSSYNVSKNKTNSITHPYFEAFREISKPVIGIDEATDFHLIDLLCMHSLGHLEISSVTYSGDLMQRLTTSGIRNWNELKSFIPKFYVKELVISYRQSPTLLEIAQHLYQTATSREAEYISYMDADNKEPKPLLYIDDMEEESIEWMAKRILEIYKAYGNTIPSIAVFLPEENQLQDFSIKLGNIDELADVDIKVMACNNGQVLGEENTVRVFSLDYIKGLEFEAVFFHNIDEVVNNSSADLMFKNLYVGLSRASFYLGITSKNEIEEISKLPNILDGKINNWKIR